MKKKEKIVMKVAVLIWIVGVCCQGYDAIMSQIVPFIISVMFLKAFD
jgi:hypothetical protein